MSKKILNATELWHLSAEGLHDIAYHVKYTEALAFLIRDKNCSILDTASGGGFPTVDLYRAGFTKIEASDADEKSVKILESFFNELKMSIPVSEGRWQDLSKKIDKKYDVVINSDNSLVYMDGWPGGTPIASGLEQISKRLSLALRSFYELLNDDGFVIIGLGKHYDPTLPSGPDPKICTQSLYD
jgi:SAM-dependent methyltransferase